MLYQYSNCVTIMPAILVLSVIISYLPANLYNSNVINSVALQESMLQLLHHLSVKLRNKIG
jgi:hypothetical protein